MNVLISYTNTPALGNVRQMGTGDVIFLTEAVEDRADWPRVLDALSAAITRGADVRWR